MFAWSYGLGQACGEGDGWRHRAIHFMVDQEAARIIYP